MVTVYPQSLSDPNVRFATKLVLFRRWRRRILPPGMDAEPAWTLLLTLYADKNSPPRSVMNLAKEAHASFSTTLRWVHSLKDRGLLMVDADPNHANRMLVRLTAHGEELVTNCLNSFEVRV